MIDAVKTCPHCGHQHDSKVKNCAECGKLMEEKRAPEGLEEGAVLDSSELAPIVESRAHLIVPKKGKVFEKRRVEIAGKVQEVNVGRFAIIRPCMSRGRRIRGLSPIYEAKMLAESANVFSGWPMYGDHLSEQIKEAIEESLMEELGEEKFKALEAKLIEAGRSIRELGGRLIKTWFDPELVTEEDEAMGYRKGGVVGDVIPQPFIYEMLENDPGILQCSINAWPRRIVVGRPSWDSSKKGAVVEGIAAKPMGSVDFVYRGGAGGRPLFEGEEAYSPQDARVAVTILESTYSSRRDGKEPKEPDDMPNKKLSEMTAEEVRKLPKTRVVEMLKEEGGEAVAETVAEALQLGGSDNGGSSTPEGTPLTQESVAEMLTEHERTLREGFEEKLKEAREEGDKELREREEARSLESVAHEALAEAQRNGLPQAWVDQLKPRYTVTKSGIGSGLKLAESDLTDEEGQKVKEDEAIREKVKDDITEAIKLMEASGGKPRVKGFGPSTPDPQADDKKKSDKGNTIVREAKEDTFLGFLLESGDFIGDDEKDQARLHEMVGG